MKPIANRLVGSSSLTLTPMLRVRVISSLCSFPVHSAKLMGNCALGLNKSSYLLQNQGTVCKGESACQLKLAYVRLGLLPISNRPVQRFR